MAYIAKFMTEDIGFTIKDVEKMLAENAKVHNVSKEVEAKSNLLDKKLDKMMANLIKLTNYNEPITEEEGEGEQTEIDGPSSQGQAASA